MNTALTAWIKNEPLPKFYKGMRVKYIPLHAKGDLNHPDCETGVISSIGERFIFVKYDNAECAMLTGDEPYTSQATSERDLVLL